jgi:hypothetical protein
MFHPAGKTVLKASRLVTTTTKKTSSVVVETVPSRLIRPDACIAWANEEDDMEGLKEALPRWFKPATDEEQAVRSQP